MLNFKTHTVVRKRKTICILKLKSDNAPLQSGFVHRTGSLRTDPKCNYSTPHKCVEKYILIIVNIERFQYSPSSLSDNWIQTGFP